jgi:hypothetical protein
VAPSWSPHKPGARVPPNHRDAITLARRMRAGDLTPVDVPTGDDEAMRDLGRGRADAIRELKTAQCRLTAFRRRQDSRAPGRATWGPAHLRWRRAVVCPPPAPQSVVQEYRRAVTEPLERLQRLAQDLTAQVQPWRLAPGVAALQALRGGPCTVAVTTMAALGTLPRFDTPRQLMHSVG